MPPLYKEYKVLEESYAQKNLSDIMSFLIYYLDNTPTNQLQNRS